MVNGYRRTVLPQFLSSHAGSGVLLASGPHRARRWLSRRPFRRALDGITATVLFGFGAALAAEQP